MRVGVDSPSRSAKHALIRVIFINRLALTIAKIAKRYGTFSVRLDALYSLTRSYVRQLSNAPHNRRDVFLTSRRNVTSNFGKEVE